MFSCGLGEEVEFAVLTLQHRVDHTETQLTESPTLFLRQSNGFNACHANMKLVSNCNNLLHVSVNPIQCYVKWHLPLIVVIYILMTLRAYHKDVHSTNLLMMIQGEHLGTGAGTGSTRQANST